MHAGTLEVAVDTSCPSEKRCVLLAQGRGTGGDSVFDVQARALSDQPLNGELAWVLRDWDRKEISRGKRAVTVPAKGEPARVQLPIGERERADRRFLEAEITLAIPGQDVAPVHAAWVAAGKETRDAKLEPESPFGKGVYLTGMGATRGDWP